MGGEGLGGGGADAAPGAGGQNHPALEQVGTGGIIEHGRLLRRAASRKRQASSWGYTGRSGIIIGLQLAACSLQLAACSLQLAACSLQLAACSGASSRTAPGRARRA